MKYTVEKTLIQKKEQLANNIFSFEVFAPGISSVAKPGQFANILVRGKTLRRPISICDIYSENGLLRFVFEIRGEGTRILSQKKESEYLDILAPLGNGFNIEQTSKKAVFIGGGIGVPPLLAASKPFGKNASVLLGFQNSKKIILADDFAKSGAAVKIATDDGSAGYHGFVTELLKEENPHIIYACGPMPMLKIISNFARENGVPCQISLEERMACGIGACLVCACETRFGYRHVCKDGPVFDANDISL